MPKIRTRINKERDDLIYFLSQFSKENLSSMGGGNSAYKDIQIAKILKKRLSINITNDNVRKIISIQRKQYV